MNCEKKCNINPEDNVIYRGTTPTVRYWFEVVNPANIIVAYLTAMQGRDVIFEKDINSMDVGEDYVDWNLDQEDTLSLSADKKCFITMTYKTANGKRYESLPLITSVARSGKDGEI